jgi:hypothetical protein
MLIRFRTGFRNSKKRQSRQRPGTFLLLAALLLMAGTTVLAEAQERMNCNTREYMADTLTTEYAEQPAGLGVTNHGTVVELWHGDGGSSWTLLLTMPNGNSCIVGAGNDWIQLETARKGNVSWKAALPRIQKIQ